MSLNMLGNKSNSEVSNGNFPPAVKGMSLMEKNWKLKFDFSGNIIQKMPLVKYSATRIRFCIISVFQAD